MPGYRVSVRKGGGAQLPALVTILSLAATATVVSILFWRLHFEAGFSWSEEPSNQFSWHPLLMSICIILMGFGSIIYRVTPWITRYNNIINQECLPSTIKFKNCNNIYGTTIN